MKVETKLFAYMTPFFIVVGVVYGYMVDWMEPVGYLALFLTGGMSGMIAYYIGFTGKRVGPRPEDRLDAEIHEGSGEQGFFSPWSWWPLLLGASAAIGFLGMAVGWWILYIGAGLAVVALVGWVFEYSRGNHAH
ncbi:MULTISPECIES: cytochrome c oxidase subunit 4 [unclassified Arthrobacter]|uniref:cytochrome c oxidase subunit 4 n=1 Tax=unclassified Arthrobacter TaxID=235627 RepID=UPI00210201EE|nr:MULTISPECIES: cytochrome c oxidase subunit 4 [unclassified Arthrobacter]MCQ1947069.1 cytochrome c oxidase subunit 4 [Arthrobacter sp. zg-Y1116]MCQ1986779.1 cytochrome c oxidase subunit 4 [Arthrobacter sp. zg-Y844]MCQ1995444.1 cytochrome c oxidase subunit 4 [Arthrobacter sp. zg-Y1171]UWX80522.1 cytochrome c oxidase subunit 4 [Arthrobacter sp. zg-Y1171]